MKFRPGDLCVLIASAKYPNRVGEECTVLAVNVEKALGTQPGILGCNIQFARIPPHPCGCWWVFECQLKLIRPKGWDAWLYDTSGVRDEKEQEQGVGA